MNAITPNSGFQPVAVEWSVQFNEWLDQLIARIKEFIETKLSFLFYSKFSEPYLAEDVERRQAELNRLRATPLECWYEGQRVEAVRIPSQAEFRTDSVVVFCNICPYLAASTTRCNSYLNRGADVVLWNPIELTGVKYAVVLKQVVLKLLEENPQCKIALVTACSAGDPAISVAYELNNPNISLVIDRGYGEASRLARSISVLAAIPCVKSVIREKFDCRGIEKIAQVPGEVLLIACQGDDDELLMCDGENLTRNLHARKPNAQLFHLQNNCHTGVLNSSAYDEILVFLHSVGVLNDPSPSNWDFAGAGSLNRFQKCAFKVLCKAWS